MTAKRKARKPAVPPTLRRLGQSACVWRKGKCSIQRLLDAACDYVEWKAKQAKQRRARK